MSDYQCYQAMRDYCAIIAGRLATTEAVTRLKQRGTCITLITVKLSNLITIMIIFDALRII
jgi:hypothetical protein